MLEHLAKRRSEKVPILTLQYVKEFHVHLLPAEDIQKTGGKGEVEKVTGMLYARAKIAGIPDAIECKTTIEVRKDWTATDEMEKAIRTSVFESVRYITQRYNELLAEKKAAEPQPSPDAEKKQPKGGEQ
jgi:hypothetical protein